MHKTEFKGRSLLVRFQRFAAFSNRFCEADKDDFTVAIKETHLMMEQEGLLNLKDEWWLREVENFRHYEPMKEVWVNSDDPENVRIKAVKKQFAEKTK